MFGAHRNLHTRPTEHNHIELSKQPARRTQMRAKEFDWQVANRLVDKLVVQLADFKMSDQALASIPALCEGIVVPHNSAVFDMIFWQEDGNGTLHANLVSPTTHAKFMPPPVVLRCIYEFCLQRVDVRKDDGSFHIRCVTDLQINEQHIRSNPVGKYGAWYDNIVLQNGQDEHGIVSSTCGNMKFMFNFPHVPNEYFAVIHRAYDYQPQYSVFTHMYRMEYQDDPDNILASRNHIDRHEGCWILDKNRHALDSIPCLYVVQLSKLKSHLLMVPYHEHSKFMIGILDRSLWADKFVMY